MKMKKLATNLIFGVFIAFFIIGCSKNDLLNPDGSVKVEGNIKLKVQISHHSWNVPYTHIYLKKSVTEFPGRDSTIYEYATQADSDGNATFTKLYPGNYYLFATGYDYYYGAWVRGQSAAVLNSSTLTDQTAQVNLQVSE